MLGWDNNAWNTRLALRLTTLKGWEVVKDINEMNGNLHKTGDLLAFWFKQINKFTRFLHDQEGAILLNTIRRFL